MTAPVPQTKAHEVVEMIKAVFYDRRHDAFKLGNIAREAKKLISTGVDPATGHMALGTVEALQYHVDETLDHFRVALGLSSQRHFRTNFLLVLKRLGLFKEALEVATEIVPRYPDDVDALRSARGMSVETFAWDLTRNVDSRLAKLGFPVDGKFISVSRFDLTVEMMKECNISHQDLLARLTAAAAVVREAGEPLYGTLFDISPEGTISYEMAVKADLDERVDLNIEIADRMVSQFDSTLAEIVTFSCVIFRDALHTNGLPELSEEAK